MDHCHALLVYFSEISLWQVCNMLVSQSSCPKPSEEDCLGEEGLNILVAKLGWISTEHLAGNIEKITFREK